MADMHVTDGPESPPRTTVVIPTRDRPAVLGRAIESVRDQTDGTWELIIVDDGSAPPAARAVQTLVDRVAGLRLIRLAESAGAAEARNTGLREARGAYVAFLDDDDVWRPRFLERMTGTLEANPAAVLAYCQRAIQSEAGEDVPTLPDLTGDPDPLAVLVNGNFIDTSTALVRRAPLEAVGGFDPELPRLQDWDLWLRLARDSRFVRVDEALVVSHTTPGGISDDPGRLVEACRLLAARRPTELRLRGRARSDFHYALATFLMVGGARTAALPHFARSLGARPWPPRRVAAAAAAVLAPAVYAAVTRRRTAGEP